MAFSDLAQSDLDGILGLNEASESITYLRRGGDRLSINAVVEKIDSEGFVDASGPEPIQVILSKSDVTTWDRQDRIIWDGMTYRIKKELSVFTDPGAWVFYCAASS